MEQLRPNTNFVSEPCSYNNLQYLQSHSKIGFEDTSIVYLYIHCIYLINFLYCQGIADTS